MANSQSSPTAPLNRYLREISRYSVLDAAEELELARHWWATRDPAAAETLVTSHLALIVKIAVGFRGYGLPLAELVAEGNVGMMKAIVRFDPERGARLATYAMWWIRATILEYIVQSSSMVRICTTPEHRRLFFNLRKLKGRLHAMDEGDLAPETVRTIATDLGVSEGDVVTMNRRLAGPDFSLNALTSDGSDEEWQDSLVDPGLSIEVRLGDRQEFDVRMDLLRGAMVHLGERERDILTARRLSDPPIKLDVLAARYGVSRERIRQIETRALDKLRQQLNPAPVEAARPRAPQRPAHTVAPVLRPRFRPAPPPAPVWREPIAAVG